MIISKEPISAYPLQWPTGWKRTQSRSYGRFSTKQTVTNQYRTYQDSKDITINEATQRVLAALNKMGIGRQDVVISTNIELRLDGLPKSGQAQPQDPGVAVYWETRKKERRCMAIDLYTKVEQNIAAVAATLDALRAIERHGGAAILDRAFTGFAALPEHSETPWRVALEFPQGAQVTADMVNARYRDLARKHHPDVGGDPKTFSTLTRAKEMALAELQGR